MEFLQTNILSISPLVYFFGGICLFAAIMVIRARNPIHSVIFLILVFCSAAGLLLLLGVEFLSIIFLVVYVGAIAVLFLFVVMMLQIKLSEIEDELFQYLPIGGFVGFFFLLETFFVLSNDFTPLISDANGNLRHLDWSRKLDRLTNLEALGQVLYTHFLLYFLLAGAVLLVAIIAAIALTISVQEDSKRQLVFQQLSRNVENAVFLTNKSKD
jgi:NADH:ubiquinone oxidoreductase subunit 6 (subunit J)